MCRDKQRDCCLYTPHNSGRDDDFLRFGSMVDVRKHGGVYGWLVMVVLIHSDVVQHFTKCILFFS